MDEEYMALAFSALAFRM